MAKYEVDSIRNWVLCGHGSTGKTTLLDAMLNQTGAVKRPASVDDGTSICDFDEEEKSHKYTIEAKVTHFDYAGKHFHVLDTPGYPDFIGPAIKAIPAAETAVIVVSAAAGIETNTRKMFELAANANMPHLIVINKMDAENVDFPGLIKAVQESFGSQCRCANLPAADKASVIYCIESPTGDSPVMDTAQAHTELIESVIEADDVAGADKLLRLTLSLGGDERRNVFAGIKGVYRPEDLLGRLVVCCANLAPRKMRFGTSEGMVLASGPGGKDIYILSPDEGAKPGMRVH